VSIWNSEVRGLSALVLIAALSLAGCIGLTGQRTQKSGTTAGTSPALRSAQPPAQSPAAVPAALPADLPVAPPPQLLAQLSVSSSSLNFGNVAVGTTSTLDVLFSNTGNADLTLSETAASGAGFTTAGVGSNLTLTAGQSATLAVDFRPSAAGSVVGSVTLSSSSSSSPILIALSGVGVETAHSVTLAWTPSNASLNGYNAYRSASSGGPWTRLNASLLPLASYSDSTVQDGQTYFYAVSAVGTNGVESAMSDPVSVLIPSQ
jgi:hypothetical protein